MKNEIVKIESNAEKITIEWNSIKERAEDMKRHALRLGAILLDVESELAGPRDGRNASGLGLKGWIEENLSEEISSSYQTLCRWKQAAQSIMTQARLENAEAVALLEDDKDKVIDIPSASVKKFKSIISSKSLKQLIFDFSAEKKAQGRKPGQNVESYKDLRKTPEENASFAWAKVVANVHPNLADMASVLPLKYASEALARLEPLIAALKKRIREAN